MPWHDHGWNHSGNGWVIMLVIMLVVLAIVVAGTMLAIQAVWRHPAPPNTDQAEQVLAERFARGEIDAEEYERRSALLRAKHR